MSNSFRHLKVFGKQDPVNPAEQELMNTCAGRMVSVLTFIVIIGCLGFWITLFLLVKDSLSTQTLSGNVINNLTCIVFFGGLVLALFTGAMIGNFLRRAFWKWLVKRRI
jgi:fumarate reductase subunit D